MQIQTNISPGDITGLKRVVIDSRTSVFVEQSRDKAEVVKRYQKKPLSKREIIGKYA